MFPKRKIIIRALTVLLFSGGLFSLSPLFAQGVEEVDEFYREYHQRGLTDEAIRTLRAQQIELLRKGWKVETVSGNRLASQSSASVCGTCHEMGVENGWSYWQAEQGLNVEGLGLQFVAPAAPTSPRFNISGGPGVDRLTPGINPGDPPITLTAPPGFGRNCIQLGQKETNGNDGNCNSGIQGVRTGCAERLTYCFTVGLLDTNFIYAYAFVMENPPSNHTTSQMPFVEFMMLGPNGDTLSCSYQKYIANENFPGQYTCNQSLPSTGGGGGGGGGNIRDTAIYKPWTIEGVNLSGYIGQTVTVVITNADCQLGGHFAHSYWDFACGSNASLVKPNCYANAPDTLRAPESADSVNTYSYLWFKNNNPVPIDTQQTIVSTTQPGDTFVVKVTTPSGCSWYARYVPLHYFISNDFAYTPGCGFANFTDSSYSPSEDDPISYWLWEFSNGNPSFSNDQHPSGIIFPPGNHPVTLISGTYSPGCLDTIQYTVSVPQDPVADFIAPGQCAGGQLTFDNNSSVLAGDTIYSFDWNFPGGTPVTSNSQDPTVTFASPGNQWVTLVVTTTDGCVDTVRKRISINAAPQAFFSAPRVCVGDSTRLQNSTTISPAGPVTYSWDLSGASPAFSNDEDPVVYYSTPGTYPVSLIAVSQSGCADTATATVIVSSPPVAAFVAPPACVGAPVNLTNNSLVTVTDTIVGYYWSLPGGLPDTSNLSQPTLVYSTPDSQLVTLVIVNSSGCADTASSYITVSANPTAMATAPSLCYGEPVLFTNTSSVQPAGSALDFLWTIPDGTPSSSNAANPVVQYAAPGNYQATLVASTGAGCSDTAVVNIQIYPVPSASFTSPPFCAGVGRQLTNLSSTALGDSIVSYSWQMPGGTPLWSDSLQPTVSFSIPDTSVISLAVTNGYGCHDSVALPVMIAAQPSAAFTAPSVCFGDVIQISNQSGTFPSGFTMNYGWAASGGILSSTDQAEPQLQVPTPGSFLLSLITTTATGCADTVEQTVNVFAIPVAQFSAPPVCLGRGTSFNNQSSISSDGSISGYSWSFPGAIPAVSNDATPTVNYTGAGAYDVTLIAITSDGCSDTASRNIMVYHPPVASISNGDSACVPVCHQFTDLSTSVDGTINQWNWSFPGSSVDSAHGQVPPEVCYELPGSYGAALEVVSSTGCRSVISLNNLITGYAHPTAGYTLSTSQTAFSSPTANFTAQSSEDVVRWEWDFGDGSPTDASGPTAVHSYSESMPGNDFYNFITSLVVMNQHGCLDTMYRPIEITPSFAFYIPNAFTPNGDVENGVFYGKGVGIRNYDISVFDRWGLELWSCHYEGSNVPWDISGEEGMSSACRWDGTYEGRPVEEDVYVWKVRLTDVFGKRHDYIGRVTVLY